MSAADDEHLALDIQKGGEQSLVLLIERHYSALLGFIQRLNGGNTALAEDIVQEVFIQVGRMIHQYQYPRPFKAWLYAIATNMARNQYRRGEERHQVVVDETTLEHLEAVEDPLSQSDNAQDIAKMLSALPAHQREVILLRFYQELSLSEIAVVLNIPLGTVKSRLSLGLRQLKAFVELEAL